MPTQKQIEAASLYANIMEEIKIRISAIDAGTSRTLNLPAQIVKEHCYLQIRMICELIALGCLVAHGDITTNSKGIHKQWAADKIMDELEKLHPDFYPIPSLQTGGTRPSGLTPRIPHPLPKDELLKLYGLCGNTLHRGSVKNLLKQKSPVQIHYPDITKLAQKLNDLLAVHLVVMRGAKHMFICVLRNAGDHHKVQIAIAERAPDQPAIQA